MCPGPCAARAWQARVQRGDPRAPQGPHRGQGLPSPSRAQRTVLAERPAQNEAVVRVRAPCRPSVGHREHREYIRVALPGTVQSRRGRH